MRSLALALFWESQMSIQIIAISNLGNALMTLGLDTREIVSKMPALAMKLMMSLLVSLLSLGCM